MTEAQARLVANLDRYREIAIAASGGVDSMTLAYVAHRFSEAVATIVHAVSPAVPSAATERVQAHAGRHGWHLLEIDAGEFQDPAYLANPVDRCYFCKSNLYHRIRSVTGLTIASGTNLDDLSDFRPGLRAAEELDVVHPFVEAGLRKSDIYALAKYHGLDDLSTLPAQPCLASRIETGIAIDAGDLRFVEAIERELAAWLPDAAAVRCRITMNGVRVECAPLPHGPDYLRLAKHLDGLCAAAGRHLDSIEPYRRGSAFLREGTR